jgi:predicted DNA-binding transcriptional regulator AlpA
MEHADPVANRAVGHNDQLLRLWEVQRLVPLSKVTIWAKEKRGEFPQRVRLSANTVAWWRSEIEAWLANLGRGVNTSVGDRLTGTRRVSGVE